MKILITGGAGFIGSNIAIEYLKNNCDVVIIDNLSTGKLENIPKNVKFFKMDILDPNVEGIFKKFKIDIINHHAAQIDVRKSVENPYYDAQINILGTIKLLEYAVKYKIKKFIFASSGGVIYGECKNNTFPDENTPANPISPYGTSKLAGEYYIQLFYKIFGLNYSILRYANVYGPRQDPLGEAGVVAIFLNKMLKNETVNIYGDGRQMRDFVFVNDIAKLNLQVLNTKNTNEILNVGTQKTTSINQLFRLLSKICNFNKKPIYKPQRKGEIFRSVLKIKKIKKIYNFQPTDLETGLKETAKFFKLR